MAFCTVVDPSLTPVAFSSTFDPFIPASNVETSFITPVLFTNASVIKASSVLPSLVTPCCNDNFLSTNSSFVISLDIVWYQTLSKSVLAKLFITFCELISGLAVPLNV